ncbi:MAG: PCI domain-containing protein [Promethearchaeota archaeon]
MSKCSFCDSQNIDFTCEKCGSSFCINHSVSTEQWYCKKHDLYYSKASATEKNFRCTVIEESKCPECSGFLMLERLTSGQYYLKCINPKCNWNSYLKTPGLFFPSKEQLAREAQRYGLIRSIKICRKKLKYIPGNEVCPSCFINLLERSPITNFSTIKDVFNIPIPQIMKIINRFMEEERIYGIIDERHHMFYYISPELREKILTIFHDTGIMKVTDLMEMLDTSKEIAIQVIYKLISRFHIKGSFSLDKNFYYTQGYILENLVKEIKEKGRVALSNLAHHFGLPKERIKAFCVNLMRTKEINAFFADKGNEVITTNQIAKEIQNFANKEGLFELTRLAKDLKIAVELARKSLHDLIKEGIIKGIFTQRREFMTLKYMEGRIKEIAKAYRTMPLRELANRLGVTESSIEENLALLISRNEIDGYIDMEKRVFQAYSLSTPEAVRIKKEPMVHEDQGNIEVLRDYDFVGGQVRFKVVVRNHSNMAINNVKVILDAPSSYKMKNPLINIPVIEAGNSRGVDFYIEPKECGISNISGTVIYKNAKGEQRTIPIRPKEVQIKCPLVCTDLSTIEDCQLAIQTLPNDARAFLIADLDPRLAFRAGIRTLKSFETNMVTSYEGGNALKEYEAEAWFCAEAKVTGGRIITRIYVSAASQSLEVRVWCNNPGQLTGFLAKVIEILFDEINIIRKIKSEEREKTIDVMAITQNLAEISDYCMLRWKAQNIRNKLHDTFVRLRKIIGDNEAILSRIEFWLAQLNRYEKDENITDEDADKLVNDVEKFKDVLARTIKI